MKYPRIIIFALLLGIPWGFAFSGETEGSFFIPVISQISAEVKNYLIRLSWVDSGDVNGPVYVYRSTAPFTGTFPVTRPAEVPYGVQSYIDEVEAPGTWYYLIIASDASGQKYPISIPFGNTIGVTIQDTGLNIDREFYEGPVPADRNISSLEASVQGDGVVISYRADEAKKAILYRSVKPLKQTQDLLGAVIVQSGIISPFTDYPVPGIPYYYGVLLEDDLIGGKMGIFPGYNATVNPVEIPQGQYRIGLPDPQGEIRSMPLPLIAVNTAIPETGGLSEIPIPTPLSLEAAKAVAEIPVNREKPPAAEKRPRIFSQDLEKPAGGEEYTLRSIAQGAFAEQNWEAAEEAFLHYLSLPRSGASEARARFYLGQAYYFSGKLREALFEFLFIQSYYPEEASEWVQAIIAKLANL
ncbi:MAG: hypothetical protein LBP32_03255, partial [Spirochaetaceae bacterium]|nr:hypothetical protein [Spirochaetaceae bacterium]